MSIDRAAFYNRAQKLANEIAQLFRDADHWNAAHPDEQPIDPDPDGSLRRMYDGLCAFLRTDTPANG